MNNDYTDEEREPLDTQNMLEGAFLAALEKTNKPKASQLRNAGVGNGEAAEESTGMEQSSSAIKDREGLLIDLYEVHDNLIELFANVDYHSSTAHVLTSQINKVGGCIQKSGGEMAEFHPLDHISGLASPDLTENAEKVIAQTTKCYKIGNIENATVSQNGKSILMTFSGSDGDRTYKAHGEISSKGAWAGNEAIDYIYTSDGGKMSVKAINENGHWVDKNEGYDVYWEVTSMDGNVAEESEPEKKSKNTETKEVVSAGSQNNLEDKEIDTDFPITDVQRDE